MKIGENMKICVMGLGKLGLPVAIYMSKFFEVFGFDIDDQAICKAASYKIRGSKTLEMADIYIIIVSTRVVNHNPDMSNVEKCCTLISNVNPNALVVFGSTLMVGTARRMSLNYGLTNVVVCPHRWWEEDQKNHGVKQLSVLGALNKASLEKARVLYTKGQIPVFEVSSLEVAEACKIAENAYRYIQIAFAEELRMIAEKSGLDFDELRKAMNTKWNVSVMEARNGIGKECLPKDTEFLASLKPELAFITRAAMDANNSYLAYLGQAKNQADKQE